MLALALACVGALVMDFFVVFAQFVVGLKRLPARVAFKLSAFFLSVAHYVTSLRGVDLTQRTRIPELFQFAYGRFFPCALNIE